MLYLVGVFMVMAALGTVINKNPVYSVLSLITTFLSASILLVLVKAEFLAMVITIVYIGAIAVFFLFVVMMVDLHEKKNKWSRKLRIGALGLSCLPIGIVSYGTTFYEKDAFSISIQSIAQYLYTPAFFVLGCILFVAMVSVILLVPRKARPQRIPSIAGKIERCTPQTRQGMGEYL